MERTISVMIGRGNVNHNRRHFITKNVDASRTIYNHEYVYIDIRDAYHFLFDEALQRYNSKQYRKDRVIDDYYEKIRLSKQEKSFHEIIIQIGDKDDMNVKSENGELAKNILDEYMKSFQERNPNLYVYSAHLHMDEETPHLHIDFIPFITNSKRGLDTRVSLKQALNNQGFKGGTRTNTEWNQWILSEKQYLAKIMKKYQIKWKQLGTHEQHLDILDFKKMKRNEEIISLKNEINDLIGIRVIHIFKDQWQDIHEFITKTWKFIEVTANVREGDNTKKFEELDIEVRSRISGYRSVHYLVEFYPTNEKVIAEIQVRTIFEEGYGEIDHRLRYSHVEIPEILKSNLLLFNRIAGSADEMASLINDL